MKKMRRFAAIAAAAAMTACMAVPMMAVMPVSAAANTISFTGEVGTAHTYTAYQIFKGDVDVATKELKDVAWAMSGTNADAFLAELQAEDDFNGIFDNCSTAAQVATALASFTTDSENAQLFAAFAAANVDKLVKVNAAPAASIPVTSDGYYLVIDESVEGGAYSRYILESVDAVTGIEVEVKSAMPTVVKKVKENVKDDVSWNPVDNEYGDQYNDVADYSFSEDVPFRLIATLPSKLTDYDTYYIKFTDSLGKGFVTPTSFTVAIGNTHTETVTVTNGTGQSTDGNIVVKTSAATDGGTDITIEIMDVRMYDTTDAKLANSAKVTVDYNAKLDVDAEVGKPGNYNDVYLTYANNPNNTGDGTSAPDDTEDTAKDGVVVFTYQLDIKKYDGVDEDKDLLPGAEFYLKNSADKFLAIADNGTYSWVDGEITFDQNGVGTMSNEDATKFTSTAGDLITIPGLDDGDYALVEFKAPDAYNRITGDITLTVKATTDNAQNHDAIGPDASDTARDGSQLEALVIEYGENTDEDAIPGDLGEGNVQIDIANNSGAVLPSTGGIGTTLFYVVGGTLAAGAGVALIAKKRMKNED